MFVAVAAALADTIDVVTDAGTVRGTLRGDHAEWPGIKFGTAGRFMNPVRPAPWTGVADATKFGPGCPQVCILPPYLCPETISEDCLYLSVYSPQPMGAGLHPVVVFIPGGGYIAGAGGVPIYNGTFAAQNGVVVVSINYRLGAFGFLWAGDEGVAGAGVYGLLDQVLAMDWVQRNVRAFGGDPAAVTIAGESAGAMSVAAHITVLNLTAAAAAVGAAGPPPFTAAIMQSHPLRVRFHTPWSAAPMASRVASLVGCASASDVACLRAGPTDRMLAAQVAAQKGLPPSFWDLFAAPLPFSPVIDDVLITGHAVDALAAGDVRDVPILAGRNTDEGIMFAHEAFSSTLLPAEYAAGLVAVFGIGAGAEAYAKYPPTNGDARPALAGLLTDAIFACPLRGVLRAIQAKSGRTQPVFGYRFDHPLSFPGWGANFTECVGRVCHGAELPFVFHATGMYTWTPGELQMSAALATLWARFGATAGGSVSWGREDANVTGCGRIAATEAAGQIAEEAWWRADFCDFWDAVGPIGAARR